MEDKSLFNSEKPQKTISGDLQNFIESMVEEIVLEEKTFDSYKEKLKLQCEKQGVDYYNLEDDLEDFLEELNMGIKSSDGLAIAMSMAFALKDAEKCYVREEKIEEITNIWNERHPCREFHPHNCPPRYLEMLDLLMYHNHLLCDFKEKIEDFENNMRVLNFYSNHESSQKYLKRLHYFIDVWEDELYRFKDDCEKHIRQNDR